MDTIALIIGKATITVGLAFIVFVYCRALLDGVERLHDRSHPPVVLIPTIATVIAAVLLLAIFAVLFLWGVFPLEG